MQISRREDFGKGCHPLSLTFITQLTIMSRETMLLPIDQNGRCVVANEVKADSDISKRKALASKRISCLHIVSSMD